MNVRQGKNMSPHILPILANLLGLCFLILSLKQLWKVDGVARFVDKPDFVAIIAFLIASVLSYMSTLSKQRADLYERIADLIFLAGLSMLMMIAVVTVLEIG
jgi:hypothetical protein